MSTKGSVNIQINVTETLDLGTNAATNPNINYGINSNASSYSSTTTPAASKVWGGTVTLTAGAATLDLTALTRSPLATVTLSGLKILAVHIKATSTNTSAVTVVPGASNGYTAMGLGVSLLPGAEAAYHNPSAGVAVDGTHKTLDLASADTDASVEVVIWANA